MTAIEKTGKWPSGLARILREARPMFSVVRLRSMAFIARASECTQGERLQSMSVALPAHARPGGHATRRRAPLGKHRYPGMS
jgi:microcystin degradation protein MlrC